MKRRHEWVEERRKLKQQKAEEETKKYNAVSKARSLKALENEIFDKYFKNLPAPFTIQNKLYKNIDKELVDKLYKLNQVNMEDLYNACDWKWNEKKELASLRNKLSRYLIIYGEEKTIAAFLQMQFMVDDDDNNPVLYIYSIQVDPTYQRKGLGGRLMHCAEAIAKSCGIPFCRLTVFKHNHSAFEMYTNKFNYSIDPISPSNFDENISSFQSQGPS